MHWKTKAKIQNAVSLLPSSFSYSIYYWLQRNFGGLRQLDPIFKLKAGIETWQQITSLGYDPQHKVFLEVGTGRAPIVPLAYWLMGAKSIITIDVNPYLKSELVRELSEYISTHTAEVKELFGSLLYEDRLEQLVDFCNNSSSADLSLLDFCQITYIAPGDARQTGLKERSIDFHTSYAVFEHIPPAILQEILEEGNRIISDDGLFVHKIDYSDHFYHSDDTISPINFLQYSDTEWDRLAGNRYMYMNRLRHDDFLAMFAAISHHIISNHPDRDERCLDLLKSKSFQLNERFHAKSEDILSIVGSWIVSQAPKII
jgi:hypothetical protein